MKDFYALTNAGRARRLRRLALEALKLYPFETKRLRLLQNGWNCVFRIDTKDGRKLALRVCLPNMATLEETLSEAMFIAALDRDTDLAPPIPVPMRDGALVAPVKVEGVPEPRNCIAFTWAPGPDLAENLTLRHYGRLGS